MSEPTLIERLRHHAKNPVVDAIGDEYLHELFGRSADHIAKLEAQLAEVEALVEAKESNEWATCNGEPPLDIAHFCKELTAILAKSNK